MCEKKATKSEQFDRKIIQNLYKEEIKENQTSRIVMLELSQYLEEYLWKHYNPTTSTVQHLLSIIFLVNEKFRQGLPVWRNSSFFFPKKRHVQIFSIITEHYGTQN